MYASDRRWNHSTLVGALGYSPLIAYKVAAQNSLLIMDGAYVVPRMILDNLSVHSLTLNEEDAAVLCGPNEKQSTFSKGRGL